MDFDEIPDDVWISIFEHVDEPSALAILVRSCRRFHGLASKLLLRELKWINPTSTLRNIEAWMGVYSSYVTLPRQMTIGVPFEFTHRLSYPFVFVSPDMQLHDLIYEQIFRFTSLSEMRLDGTVISPYVYNVLGMIPNLRSLHLENCTVIDLHSSFRARTAPMQSPHPSQDPQGPPFQYMSLTQLSLHRVAVPSDLESSPFHPLCFLTVPTLASLSIVWNSNYASRYAQSRWALHSLAELDVIMPLLSRDLLDELAGFVNRCQLGPKVKLKVEKHNLSDTQMATVHVPSRGLWSYEGPLSLLASSPTKSTRPTLTHVKINETLELSPLLEGLEKLPILIEELEIQVGKWDIEVLFAVKELFKGIKKLIVRYVRGALPANLLVLLGADILFCLPNLQTIKLLGPKLHDDANNHQTGAIGSLSGPGSTMGPHANHNHIHRPTPLPPTSVFHNVFVSSSQGTSQISGSTLGLSPGPSTCNRDISDENYDDELLDEDHPVANYPVIQTSRSTLNRHRPASSSSNLRPMLVWDSDVSASSSGSPSISNTSSNFSTSSLSASAASGSRTGVFSKESSFRSPKSYPDSRKPDSPSPLSTFQAELGDYLIGWSRYCSSLRMVQIDHRWWWERRFVGDPWVPHLIRPSDERSSEKGKEREKNFSA